MKHCNRCKLAIDTSKERYIKVEDIEKKETLSKLYFHKECWRSIMVQKSQVSNLNKQAMKFLNFAKNKLGMDDTGELIIK